MLMTSATLVPIFATPFATVSVAGSADLNPALLSLFSLRATEAHRDPAMARDPLCFRSREDLFEWENEAVAQVKGEMLGGLCAAVMAVNFYTDAEFDGLRVQARAHFTIVRPDGCIPAASLPLASWCAIYCVAAPPPAPTRPDSGVLRLYETRLGTMFMDAANWRLRPPFGAGHHMWRPVPGQMAVFPASAPHEVALNRSEGDVVLVTARARFANPRQQAAPPW
jgi:hypothetical protein